MTDPRDLIQRLTEALPIRWNMGDSDLLLLNEARAYLAAPDEPDAPDGREPTDEELQRMLYYEFSTSTGHGTREDPIGFARAVLARWGSR